MQFPNMYIYSKDKKILSNILVSPNILSLQQKNMYKYPKDNYFLWSISKLRASASKRPFKAAYKHVWLSQRHLFFIAHFNIAS